MYNNAQELLKDRREKDKFADALAETPLFQASVTKTQDPTKSFQNGFNQSYGLSGGEGNKSISDIGGLLGQGVSLFQGLKGGESAAGASGSPIGLIGNAIGGLRKGFDHKDDNEILGGFGNGVQGFFGVDSDKDSDVMQSLKGAGNGALAGTAIMPGIGTIIGGVLGLGSSFLDDI